MIAEVRDQQRARLRAALERRREDGRPVPRLELRWGCGPWYAIDYQRAKDLGLLEGSEYSA